MSFIFFHDTERDALHIFLQLEMCTRVRYKKAIDLQYWFTPQGSQSLDLGIEIKQITFG
jgi:hypothetical protein